VVPAACFSYVALVRAEFGGVLFNSSRDHQHLTVANEPQQRIHRRAPRLVGQTQGAGHRDRHHAGIGDRSQIHMPNTVTEFGRDARRDLDGETGLPGATGTCQRHNPVVCQQLPHVSHLCTAANQAGELSRKVVRTHTFRGTQWRELVAQVGVAQLHDPLGTGQITQLVSP
jgi:hypothetical protein